MKTIALSLASFSISLLTLMANADDNQASNIQANTDQHPNLVQLYALNRNDYFSNMPIERGAACGEDTCRDGDQCCEEDGLNWCVGPDESCDE